MKTGAILLISWSLALPGLPGRGRDHALEHPSRAFHLLERGLKPLRMTATGREGPAGAAASAISVRRRSTGSSRRMAVTAIVTGIGTHVNGEEEEEEDEEEDEEEGTRSSSIVNCIFSETGLK